VVVAADSDSIHLRHPIRHSIVAAVAVPMAYSQMDRSVDHSRMGHSMEPWQENHQSWQSFEIDLDFGWIYQMHPKNHFSVAEGLEQEQGH